MNKLSDTKAAAEVRSLETFFDLLNSEPDRAFYGMKHVERASQSQAIDTLLISDKVFWIFKFFPAFLGHICLIKFEIKHG